MSCKLIQKHLYHFYFSRPMVGYGFGRMLTELIGMSYILSLSNYKNYRFK